MSQREIAELAGISQATVCRALNGTHQLRRTNAKRLEAATGVDKLIWLEGDPAKIQAALEASPLVNN